MDPVITLSTLKKEKPEDLARSRVYVKEGVKIEGYDIGLLFDQLIKKNQKPVRLTLKSSSDREEFLDRKNGPYDLCVMC